VAQNPAKTVTTVPAEALAKAGQITIVRVISRYFLKQSL